MLYKQKDIWNSFINIKTHSKLIDYRVKILPGYLGNPSRYSFEEIFFWIKTNSRKIFWFPPWDVLDITLHINANNYNICRSKVDEKQNYQNSYLITCKFCYSSFSLIVVVTSLQSKISSILLDAISSKSLN